MRRLVLIFIVGVLSIILTLFLYSFYSVAFVKYVPMSVEVGRGVGFSLDTDILDFGKTFPGGVLSREIIVSHNVDERLKARIIPTGEIKDWVYLSDNNFHLAKNEVRKLAVFVYVPKNTSFGNHTGTLRVFFQRTIT
ncbi:hypothetical protein D6745_01405 [Candidatus Woesearchaeota archaeon]|nr:MAG: hypothetical protein D6745_01405 [Candidatus Woesearchaeota archaeon]